MYHLPGLLIGVLIFLNLGLSAPVRAAGLERHFDTAARLTVDADASTLEIHGGSRYGIDIAINPLKGELEDFEIDFDHSGDELKITVKRKKSGAFGLFNWFGGKSLKIEANLPRATELDLATSGGSVSVGNIEGYVRAITSGGSISVSDLDGKLDARTSGGSIRLAGLTGAFSARTSGGSIDASEVFGDGELKTSGGSIKIDRCGGAFLAKTSGGSIKISGHAGSVDARTSGGGVSAEFVSPPERDCVLKTSGGSITLHLPSGSPVWLDAATSGGRVHCPIKLDQATMEKRHVRGAISGGGPNVMLQTSGGSIRINES